MFKERASPSQKPIFLRRESLGCLQFPVEIVGLLRCSIRFNAYNGVVNNGCAISLLHHTFLSGRAPSLWRNRAHRTRQHQR
jgi:hypothetical protein